jgi:hypothetical protein
MPFSALPVDRDFLSQAMLELSPLIAGIRRVQCFRAIWEGFGQRLAKTQP